MNSLITLATGVALIVWAYYGWLRRGKNQELPSVGYSGRLSSYITALRFITNSQNIVNEGYARFKGQPFRIPHIDHWMVVATDPQSVEDIRRATDGSILSFDHAIYMFLQTDYVFGPQFRQAPYHVELIRSTLTRNIHALFADIYDELTVASRRAIPPSDDWKSYPAMETCIQIVSQITNRVFVGTDLCRDDGYLGNTLQFTLEVVKAANIIKAFPTPLKPLAARLFSNVKSCTRRSAMFLEAVVKGREDYLGVEADQKPNDMLMWCMEAAEGEETTTTNLALRILLINFVANHTTSQSLIFSLYQLAVHPEVLEPLRSEVRGVVSEYGWSKSSIDKMKKLDSFIKETLRLVSPGIWAMQRMTMKPFTFSSGHTIPGGTMIACPVLSIQQDEEYYQNAAEFDPWRFVEEDEPAEDRQYSRRFGSGTSPTYILFGHGKHACPGRFFAAAVLKVTLAHLVSDYDIGIEGGKIPDHVYLGSACIPGKAMLMFRKART